MLAYTYRIGWSKLNKHYYGVQYNKKADPKVLWESYFTSSDKVKEFRDKYGEPDIVEIRKTFKSKHDAISHERTVLKRLGVPGNNNWLNKTYSMPEGFHSREWTEARRKKHSEAISKSWSDGHRDKSDFIRKMTGQKRTQKTKDNIAAGNAYDWIITDPDGNKINVNNLRKWTKENNLDQGNLSRGDHKGYSCKKV